MARQRTSAIVLSMSPTSRRPRRGGRRRRSPPRRRRRSSAAAAAAAAGAQDRDEVATELSSLEVDAVAEFDRRAAEIFADGKAPDMSGIIFDRVFEWRCSMGLVQ
mmetsp:Transcript_136219/g.344944  ORF Transcript_136219/g.344944 Transcript_136219/m.344944 type:complete len:105 (+) Transcript_136219:916-1230(+)